MQKTEEQILEILILQFLANLCCVSISAALCISAAYAVVHCLSIRPSVCHISLFSSSSRMCIMNHNWSATKQRLHPKSIAEISRHSVLSGDRIRQCETSSGSRHKDSDQCLAISFCRHRSVPVPCENGSAQTIVAEGGRNLVAGLWGHTLGEN